MPEEVRMNEQRCLYCGGHLKEEQVTRVQHFRGRWVVIENLSALVCQQCGERYYTPEAHDLALSLVSKSGQPARREQIDVYDAAIAGR
jgi:YgiT-type zinc finger domain-containing protein